VSFRKKLPCVLGISFGVMVLTYIIIMFVMLPSNRFFAYPVHYDDYNVFARTLSLQIRPVSVLLVDGLSYLGERSFFFYVDVMTIVDAYLVLVFVSIFLRKKIAATRTIIFSLALLSLPAYIDADKQTAGFISITSAFFGLLTLLAMCAFFEGGKRWLIIVASVSYALSVFCKEDYILPVLVLALYYAVYTWPHPAMRRWSVTVVGSFVSIILAYEYYSQKIFPSPFISTSNLPSHPYYINTSLRSLWNTFGQYFRLTFPSLIIAIVVVSALLYAIFLDRRPRVYVLLLLAGSVIAPYCVLPNHIFALYCINWAPWILAVVVCLELPANISNLTRRFSQWRRRGYVGAQSVVALAFALVPIFQLQDARATEAHYYLTASSYNHAIIQSLFSIKDDINSAKLVGIRGVRGFNPFMTGGNITYLSQHGLRSHWVLFLEPDDPLLFFYRDKTYENVIATDNQDAAQIGLTYAYASDVGQFPGALLLDFDSSGKLADKSLIAPDLYPKRLQFSRSDPAIAEMQGRAIVSGIYPDNGSPWQWTARQWQVLLQTSGDTNAFTVTFVVPDYPIFRKNPQAITVSLGTGASQSQCCFNPGEHTVVFDLPPDLARTQGVMAVTVVNATTFSPKSIGIGEDTRELGVLLVSAGFN
jgi:hypothetical protein